MEIQTNERVFISGTTGSGKSYFMKSLLPFLNRFVFYDPKHQHNEINAVLARNLYELEQALQNYNKIVYRPLFPNDQEFNEICRLIYIHKNTVFIIDEISYHVNSWKMQPYHTVLMTTGRTLNIGVWNCTQRPREVCHNTILSESEHIIAFYLKLNTDMQKLAENFDPLFYQADKLNQYGFIYYNALNRTAQIMPPV